MTESEVRAVLEWGWTSYKKMPWRGKTAATFTRSICAATRPPWVS